jgi:hypothetical protein
LRIHERTVSTTIALLAVVACGPGQARTSSSASLASNAPPPSAPTSPKPKLPSRWVGVAVEQGRIVVSVTEVGETPRRGVIEPLDPEARPASFTVTDVAYDTRRERIYVGTCCEPPAGRVRRIEWRSTPAFDVDDQGVAVDVGGPLSAIARSDAFGALAVQRTVEDEPERRPDAGVADVAVDGTGPTRVVALVDARRLRHAEAPGASPAPVLWRGEPRPGARWDEAQYALPADATFCRVLPLRGGAVGLLAGALETRPTARCTGERVDVYDTSRRELRRGRLTFASRIRHLSIDESSTYLIFTTVEGAVGWRTLDGRGESLAAAGFVAADW